MKMIDRMKKRVKLQMEESSVTLRGIRAAGEEVTTCSAVEGCEIVKAGCECFKYSKN